jgi:hypothetical protein
MGSTFAGGRPVGPEPTGRAEAARFEASGWALMIRGNWIEDPAWGLSEVAGPRTVKFGVSKSVECEVGGSGSAMSPFGTVAKEAREELGLSVKDELRGAC